MTEKRSDSRFERHSRQSQEASEQAAFLQAVMTNMGEGLYTLDAQGLVTYVNQAAERLTGWTAAQLSGRRMHDVIHYQHPDGKAFPIEDCPGFRVLREGGILTNHEDVFIRKDGTFFPVVYSSSPLLGSNNKIVGLVVVFRDVTAQRQAEAEQRKVEKRFATFMRHLPGAAWMKDLEGRYLLANPNAEQVFGRTFEEIQGRTDEEIFPPETARRFLDNDRRALTEGVVQVTEVLRQPDGVDHYSIVSKFAVPGPDGEPACVGGVAFDITSRMQAEEALRAAQAELRMITDTMATGVTRCSRDLRYLWVNRAYADWLGRRADQIAGRRILDVVGEAGYETIRPYVERVLAGQEVEYETEIDFFGAGCRWISAKYRPTRDAEGSVDGWVAVVTDISEHKAAEEALRTSEQRLRATFDHAGVGIVEVEKDDRFIAVNDRVCQMLGYSCQELLGMTVSQLTLPEDREMSDRFNAEIHEGVRDRADYEKRYLRREGSSLWVHVTVSAIRDEEGRWVRSVATIEDISGRKASEQALRESQARLQEANAMLEQRVSKQTAEIRKRANQLQALAVKLSRAESQERRRVASVLHDHLQQLLVAAKINLSTLQAEPAPKALQERLHQVHGLLDESISTSRTLTAELSPPILYKASFAAALGWLAEQMREKHGLDVEVEADEQANPSPDELRFLLFQSVRELLFNIVKHARTTRARIRMDHGRGDEVRIVITDHGVGFDPNRNAKENGGLGLFGIRERLEPLSGRLDIDSSPGKGTTMTVTAPLRLAVARTGTEMPVEAITVAQPQAEPATANEGKIRVLLADDHEVVRDGLARLLESHTDIHVVAQARNGQQAVDLALSLRPDVIVMDVSMPVLDGIEATRIIVTRQPGICVIGLSMHEDTGVAAVMREAGAAIYLTKTSAPERLVAAVRGCSG